MNELLQYFEVWKESKSDIFDTKNYNASITEVESKSKKSCYIDVDTSKIIARATIWETGELELEALAIDSEETVILKSALASEIWELDDLLNWWLDKIDIYQNR